MSGYDSTFEPEAGEVEERRWKLRPLSQATPRQTRFLVRRLIPLDSRPLSPASADSASPPSFGNRGAGIGRR